MVTGLGHLFVMSRTFVDLVFQPFSVIEGRLNDNMLHYATYLRELCIMFFKEDDKVKILRTFFVYAEFVFRLLSTSNYGVRDDFLQTLLNDWQTVSKQLSILF